MSYDPTLILDLAETTLTLQSDNLHWCYVRVTVTVIDEVETQTASIVASETHIDPMQYWESDGQIHYKIGHFSPVVDGKREAHIIWGNVKGGAGANGKSAYEIAVLNGFGGTQAEWLLSLKGNDGYTPQKGTDYFDGNDGYTPYIQGGYWYVNGVSTGVPASGENGKNTEMSVQAGYVCWRLVGDVTWNQLYQIPAAGLSDAPADGKLYGRKNNIWTEVVIPSDNSVVVRIDFQSLDAFEYTCPVALKFTSQTSESTAATLSVALNTNMTQFQNLTVTPTALGLVILTGEQL